MDSQLNQSADVIEKAGIELLNSNLVNDLDAMGSDLKDMNLQDLLDRGTNDSMSRDAGFDDHKTHTNTNANNSRIDHYNEPNLTKDNSLESIGQAYKLEND